MIPVHICLSIVKVCLLLCSSMYSMFRSATVDSDLFSRYFGHCPVITAQGRTHPVSTYFLEDIYETVNYRLASDSPAYLRDYTSTKEKVSLFLDLQYCLSFSFLNLSSVVCESVCVSV